MATEMECRLIQACERGNLDEFIRLYDEDNSILHKKLSGFQETPLHLAIKSNKNDLVKQILGYGGHTATAMNGNKETPLHVACRLGFLNFVTQLLDACSCVPYMLNKDRQCALVVACSCEQLEVASNLCEKMDFKVWDGIGASCLWIAASKGHQGVVQKILNKNVSLASRKDENGFSALHLAAREGKIEVIKELLGKDRNLSFLRENDGRTPLHLAVANRKVVAVKEFLPGSTSLNGPGFRFTDLINIADNDGNTILHHAATVDLQILGTLVEMKGMDVNAVNKQGMTALDILEQQTSSTPERKKIIQRLKDKKGANPISVTPVQQTLMVVAALVCTITFQAGLNPPGGFWPDSNGTNQTDHKAGKAIQNTTDPLVLMFFTVFDAMAFTSALALIPIIFISPKKTLTYVNILAAAALIFMQVTFILGLVMVSDRKLYSTIEIGACLLPSVLVLWIARKAY